MATASDDFNRADGALGSNWTTVIGGGGEVAGNLARGNSATESGSMWTIATTDFADNHEVQVTKVSDTFMNFGGPAVRMSTGSGGNGYVYFNNGSLQKVVAGTRSTIDGGLATFDAGDVIRIRATGTTIECWKNGVSQGTFGDSDLATGQPGMLFYNDDSGALDDWSATDEFGGGAANPFFTQIEAAIV